MIPELDLTRIRHWVDTRNSELPERAQGLIRYELDVTDRTVTILECRPPWQPDLGSEGPRFPIARLRSKVNGPATRSTSGFLKVHVAQGIAAIRIRLGQRVMRGRPATAPMRE